MSASKEFNANVSLLELNRRIKSSKKGYVPRLAVLNALLCVGMEAIYLLQQQWWLGALPASVMLFNFIFAYLHPGQTAKSGLGHLLLSLNLLIFLMPAVLLDGIYPNGLLWTGFILIQAQLCLAPWQSRWWWLGGLIALVLAQFAQLYLDLIVPTAARITLPLLVHYEVYLWAGGMWGLVLIIWRQNQQIEKTWLEGLRSLHHESQQYKKEIRQLNSRNLRLVQMYQNLNRLEATHEQKSEIMTEVAKILDKKHKTILSLHDRFEAQSMLLEEINENITNSIRYAQKIQEAIVPEAEWVVSHFREAFIFYQAKDIVSGDFYWFEQKEVLNQKVKILMAGDCTGHGVPGAFMTVLGHSLINEIVHESHIVQPDWILNELDRKVLETFSNKRGEVQIHDGMDMVCLVIDEEAGMIHYAAAHNPLYYVRKNKLYEVKGSRYSVGSSQYGEKKVFKLHSLPVQRGDVFYIFTDGFQDQFGEQAQRKYMTRRFRNFLQSINRMPLEKQKKIIESEFNHWKGGIPQTDDVLIIGFRI
ncbi:MAG: SpoIIE family protein phosphatase [Microscillaceae bacterium]|nr:SpoIIE family protein phosphatase [Microscillaceae bacterium]